MVEEGEVEQQWAAPGFTRTHHFLWGEWIHPFLYQSLHVVLSEVFALLLLFEADEAWRIALLPLHQLILRVGWRTLGPVTTQTLLQVPTAETDFVSNSIHQNLRFGCFTSLEYQRPLTVRICSISLLQKLRIREKGPEYHLFYLLQRVYSSLLVTPLGGGRNRQPSWTSVEVVSRIIRPWEFAHKSNNTAVLCMNFRESLKTSYATNCSPSSWSSVYSGAISLFIAWQRQRIVGGENGYCWFI